MHASRPPIANTGDVYNGPCCCHSMDPTLPTGLFSMCVPLYIAESSPASMRGKLVVLNIAVTTGGQFLASVVGGAFSEVDQGWR